jgi:predicted DNA-binding transcriptional regulator YafY
MNLSKSALRRYKIIDQALRNKMRPYPNMQELIALCEQLLDYSPSIETLQKDIANMRLPYPDGFDAPIVYNRLKRGYAYSDLNYSISGIPLRDEDMQALAEAVEFMQAMDIGRISESFNHAIEKIQSASIEQRQRVQGILPVLQNMTLPQTRGFEHIKLFYKACREQMPVSCIHYSYKKRVFNVLMLHPFLIKEFENRWYIYAYSETHGNVRTFGLDRIFEPVFVKSTFIKTGKAQAELFLKDVYGVFPVPGAKKCTVKIHVSQLGTQYFQAFPLHSSQVIKKENSGTSVICFTLIPTIELARFILAQGGHVKIIQPKWFKQFTSHALL